MIEDNENEIKLLKSEIKTKNNALEVSLNIILRKHLQLKAAIMTIQIPESNE